MAVDRFRLLEGKHAPVIGSGTGLGREIALEFAREGGVGQPIDVAKICVYMASDAADFADWHDVKME